MTAQDVVEAYLQELRANLELLEMVRPLPLEAYLQAREQQKLVERCLQLAIECMIDIADHLISAQGWGRPASGEEALEILAQRQVLPRAYRDRIKGIAGFRNVLVHAYLRLDQRVVYDYLQRLEDSA